MKAAFSEKGELEKRIDASRASATPRMQEDAKRWTRHLHGRTVTVTPCLRFQRKQEGKMILQQLVHDEEAGVSEWVDVPMTVEY